MTITTMFWDVGGVLLTNGWDTARRRLAAKHFGMDWDEFQRLHNEVTYDFETGRIGLETYLDRTVFHRDRAFTRETFREYMYGQSAANDDVLDVADACARSGNYFMATLNNESWHLNQYRIDHFRLRDRFRLFVSSSFVGVKKPDVDIYRVALALTQRSPGECVFIDDLERNLAPARKLGMHVIHYTDARQLSADLESFGIPPADKNNHM